MMEGWDGWHEIDERTAAMDELTADSADMIDAPASADALGEVALHVVFDGPPGPEAGRFVECETPDGRSINAGEWHQRPDGYWELRVSAGITPTPKKNDVERVARALVPILSGSQEDDWGNALPDMQFDDLTPAWQARHLEYATAALAAMSPAGEVERAVLAERERCAGIADDEYNLMLRARQQAADEHNETSRDRIDGRARTASRIAQAIREPKP